MYCIVLYCIVKRINCGFILGFHLPDIPKKSIITIKPDIRYPAKLLAGCPAAGNPAKSVSGTTLFYSYLKNLKDTSLLYAFYTLAFDWGFAAWLGLAGGWFGLVWGRFGLEGDWFGLNEDWFGLDGERSKGRPWVGRLYLKSVKNWVNYYCCCCCLPMYHF